MPTLLSLPSDHIFNVAKNIIMPLPCEWSECDVVMNCWNKLLQV